MSIQSLINYNELIENLPDEFRNSKGKGIKIAVLDTGVNQSHPDLSEIFSNVNLPSQDYTKSNIIFADINGHGTHVTGLISARAKRSIGIIGVAPECNIQNLKVLLDSGDSVGDLLSLGLNQIISQTSQDNTIDIINMSLEISGYDYHELIPTINKVSDFSILVAAAGENGRLLISSTPFCPAYSSSVISVGVIDDTFLKSYPNAIFHHRVDYLMPFIDLLSCSTIEKNLYQELKGSSMATGLVSGIIALILSFNAKKGNSGIEFIKSELDKIATPYSAVNDLSKLLLIKPKYQ